MLSSFDGRVIATDPLWPDGFHSSRHFFSTCWEFSDRAVAWAGDPLDFLDWVSSMGEKPDCIVINGDVGDKYPTLLPRIVELFGHKPMCGTEVAKMNRWLRPIYNEIERFDGFSWRVNASLSGEKWEFSTDGNNPDEGWSLADMPEAQKLLGRGSVVLFCRKFGRINPEDLDRWYSDFATSSYDVSISMQAECFMAKGRSMTKVLNEGWDGNIGNLRAKCYEADVLIHVRV